MGVLLRNFEAMTTISIIPYSEGYGMFFKPRQNVDEKVDYSAGHSYMGSWHT